MCIRDRLMVGQEMLTRPRLLCCDEPTSGLDSATACVVVEALRDLARERRVAVVASIHQPSSRLFLLFDELLLLRKGGLTYRGSTSDAGDAFAGAPFHLPCPAAYSAPDWLMEIVVENKVDSDDEKKRVLDERYGPATLPPRTEPLRSLRAQKRRQRYAAPLTEQIAVLSRRSWKAVAPKVFKRSSLLLHGGNATLGELEKARKTTLRLSVTDLTRGRHAWLDATNMNNVSVARAGARITFAVPLAGRAAACRSPLESARAAGCAPDPPADFRAGARRTGRGKRLSLIHI